MKKMIRARVIVALAFTAFLAACQQPAMAPVFEQGWVRAMPPSANMTAAYGVLRNGTAAPLTFVSFSSPAFGDVSLHRTVQVDGMTRMREVESLTLQPGEQAELQPGGLHLMLMMPAEPLRTGADVPLVMTAADGRSFRFDVPVEQR
ncbi:MAG: copper chaperone PCu(A)C [Xanthomonadales bacterium]